MGYPLRHLRPHAVVLGAVHPSVKQLEVVPDVETAYQRVMKRDDVIDVQAVLLRLLVDDLHLLLVGPRQDMLDTPCPTLCSIVRGHDPSFFRMTFTPSLRLFCVEFRYVLDVLRAPLGITDALTTWMQLSKHALNFSVAKLAVELQPIRADLVGKELRMRLFETAH